MQPARADYEVLIIGAGPAGLAAAAMLRRSKVDALIVERAGDVGNSWRSRYDHLHLNTVRWLSHLPGLRMPRSYGRWPSKDSFVEYLEQYQRHFALPVQWDTVVERVERANGSWSLKTTGGELSAQRLVITTGYMREPAIPEWPGRDKFAGDLIHSASYRNPTPYIGRNVLVVGTGNSGADIAFDLAKHGAGRVWISVRSGPNIVKAETLGVPYALLARLSAPMPRRLVDFFGKVIQRSSIGDLSRYGIPGPTVGGYTSIVRDLRVPIVDFGFVRQVKQKRIEVVKAVEGFQGSEVLLSGGARLSPDLVVAATGYRPALERLVGGLGVLAPNGRPVVHGARFHASAPRLYFVGFVDALGGQLREMGKQAKALARAIASERKPKPNRDGHAGR